jgi:hypothetical protein
VARSGIGALRNQFALGVALVGITGDVHRAAGLAEVATPRLTVDICPDRVSVKVRGNRRKPSAHTEPASTVTFHVT